MSTAKDTLSGEIMEEVKRYDDGMGCTRRQLVDRILMLIDRSSRVSAPIVAPVVNFEAWTSIDAWLRDNPTATAAECLAELVKRIKIESAPASTVAPVGQSDVKWDKSGLKEACQRGLAMGRYRQEFDLQLLLDMLLEIERLEAVAVGNHG